MRNQENFIEVEFSFIYMHLRDAETFHELAKAENSKLKSFYARHAILSTVFVLEAMINRVYDDFCLHKADSFEKLPLFDRWLIAPMVCGDGKPVGNKFDISKEPFQSFQELIKIRNWIVHPKPKDYVPAIKTPWTITISETDTEIPWIETQEGSVWPQTHIPKNPFEIADRHSEKAIGIYELVKNELLRAFHGIINDEWLWKIKIKKETPSESEHVSIDSLWGGYTPDPNEL